MNFPAVMSVMKREVEGILREHFVSSDIDMRPRNRKRDICRTAGSGTLLQFVAWLSPSSFFRILLFLYRFSVMSNVKE